MTARVPFEYAVLRAVPRVERGESITAGVVVYCRERDFLGGRIDLDAERPRAVDPQVDVGAVHAALEALADVCRPDAPGPAAALEIGARFRWVTAPAARSFSPRRCTPGSPRTRPLNWIGCWRFWSGGRPAVSGRDRHHSRRGVDVDG